MEKFKEGLEDIKDEVEEKINNLIANCVTIGYK